MRKQNYLKIKEFDYEVHEAMKFNFKISVMFDEIERKRMGYAYKQQSLQREMKEEDELMRRERKRQHKEIQAALDRRDKIYKKIITLDN